MDSDSGPSSFFEGFSFKALARRRGSEPLGLQNLYETPSAENDDAQPPDNSLMLRRRASLAVGVEADSRPSSAARSSSLLGRLLTDPMMKNMARRSTLTEAVLEEQNEPKESALMSGIRLAPEATPQSSRSVVAGSISSSLLNRSEQFVGVNQQANQSKIGLPDRIKVSKRELNLFTPSSF